MLKKILENKKLLADIILVLVILVIALSALLITALTRDNGKSNGDNNVGDSNPSGGNSGDEDGKDDVENPDGDTENSGGETQTPNKTKNMVVVFVDGKKVAEYPLAEDGVYEIVGYKGGTNTLVIEGGKAYISEASCPQNAGDVACVDQGKKYRVGELITCLPNRVIVEITGESEDLLS